ncbi:MAG: hypothetical protein JNJ46_17160 [Myxococcales bacterium]|nr:hypothetical protein [Myxococcales bacterium]
MPTWEQTQKYIQDHFQVAVCEPTWLGLTWRFPDGEQREFQRQRIQLVQALGQPYLLILCDIAPEAALPPRDVLRHSASMAIGGLSLAEGLYVVRHVMPLSNLTWDVLATALEYTAHEAARLRVQSRSAPSTP